MALVLNGSANKHIYDINKIKEDKNTDIKWHTWHIHDMRRW